MNQLDIITRTIAILDNRLTLTEDRISSLLAQSRGLVVANPTTISTKPDRNTVAPHDQNDSFDGQIEDVVGANDSDDNDVEDH